MKIDFKDFKNKFSTFKTFTDDDFSKVMQNKNKILKMAENGKLCLYLDDIKLYFKMLKDIFTGKYKRIPAGTVAAIIGTLLYVLCPQDIIPDYIPGIGYIDDAAIVSLCLNFTRYDVEEYKKYKMDVE